MRKIIDLLFSRVVIVGLLILFQAAVLVMLIWRLSNYFVFVYGVLLLLSILVTLWLVNKDDNPSYKLAWIIPIMAFPLFGGLFYLLFGNTHISKKMSLSMEAAAQRTRPLLQQDETLGKELEAADKSIQNQSYYLTHRSGYPLFIRTETSYLSPGERKFETLKAELEKAEHFIFLEYFIIEPGVMWNSILEILRRKVSEGVDVRVVYDDCGCLTTLPDDYDKQLEKMGIQCVRFNRFRPVLSIIMNHRDHRKIAVIDGHTGFMGGINLADEYINAVDKHGHWKDAAVMLKGEAVWSLTVMFLQMWETMTGISEEYDRYRPHVNHSEAFAEDGFVQPFSDSPIDHERVGEMVYTNIICRAKDYVYIASPYLIIDNEMSTALILAAKSGVDVRIITPHHGDKWYVHSLTRAYYRQLIEGGVKIYEYEPGFIHSKLFIADDEVSVVGTINLDYRSLYLHFECGVWMYRSRAVMEAKKDYLGTLERCIPITLDSELLRIGPLKRLVRAVLRLFAPLM